MIQLTNRGKMSILDDVSSGKIKVVGWDGGSSLLVTEDGKKARIYNARKNQYNGQNSADIQTFFKFGTWKNIDKSAAVKLLEGENA